MTDLLSLTNYDFCLVLDDSGSMQTAVEGNKTRWSELLEVAQIAVEIGSALDDNGVDVMFLNREGRSNVRGLAELKVSAFLKTMTFFHPLFLGLFQSSSQRKHASRRCMSASVRQGVFCLFLFSFSFLFLFCLGCSQQTSFGLACNGRCSQQHGRVCLRHQEAGCESHFRFDSGLFGQRR